MNKLNKKYLKSIMRLDNVFKSECPEKGEFQDVIKDKFDHFYFEFSAMMNHVLLFVQLNVFVH